MPADWLVMGTYVCTHGLGSYSHPALLYQGELILFGNMFLPLVLDSGCRGPMIDLGRPKLNVNININTSNMC